MRPATPLGLFSILWAAAAALHHLEARPLAGLPIYPFVVLLLVFPERPWAIASFALAHGALLVLDLPSAANHSILALLVDGLLLIGCAQLAFARGEPQPSPRRLFAAIQGPIRATVAVIYLFAVFHKLNRSFFDPGVSCAATQLAKALELHGLESLRLPEWVFALNIPLTLASEAAIIALLLWPRFTHVGAVLGLVFHTGLAWASFFDFATVIFAMYLFFFSWESLEGRLQAIPRWAVPCFLLSFAALAAVSFYFHGWLGDPALIAGETYSLRADTLICLFWMLMVWPLLLPVFARAGQGDGRWTGVGLAWAVPLIALLNGVTPYLGLKTVANYSMFSNLRTEGGRTNHLLVPPGLFSLAGYQEDLARVSSLNRRAPPSWPWWVRLAGGDRWVRRNSRWAHAALNTRVPFAELRRTLQVWRELGFTSVSVGYERAGKFRFVEDAFADPELMRPMPFWERKLMAFRAVDDDGFESSCRW